MGQRRGADKETIEAEVQGRFGYELERSLEAIRPGYRFEVSCQGSVPESLLAFLASADYESAVRNAISLGGDADTMACVAGGIAQAFYGTLPEPIAEAVKARLPDRFLDLIDRFERRYGIAASASRRR